MSANTGEKVFTSWKEIATFFGKGVRTVQRWERKFGLPISRPTTAKNVVLATESELREWIRRSSSQLAAEDGAEEHFTGASEASVNQISDRLKRLEDETARLAETLALFSERVDALTGKDPVAIKVQPALVRRPPPKPLPPVGK